MESFWTLYSNKRNNYRDEKFKKLERYISHFIVILIDLNLIIRRWIRDRKRNFLSGSHVIRFLP